ncbi:MAG: cupin domain-containing protein [Saprospiraceae bacterium]
MIFKTTDTSEYFLDEGCFIREIMNTSDISNVSISQARVEVGKTTELHTLTADEMYYILSGKGEVEIAGNAKQLVTVGDVAYIKAEATQRITNTGDEDLIFLCICAPRFTPDKYKSVPE